MLSTYKAPAGRVYFTGEHTSEHYNGYVHGAYLAGKNLELFLMKHCKFLKNIYDLLD
jgi:hypothetical protein